MRARFASSAPLLAAAVLLGAATGAHGLRFEAVFASRAAPPHAHARVLYRTPDGVHRLELWREGDRLLRRDTDDVLTTLIRHAPGDAAYRLDLFDHRRRIHTVVDRDSLYRVGRFTDWADLAHGVRHPAADYRLIPSGSVATPVAPAAPCRWYDLAQAGRTARICWSEAEVYPVEIIDGRGKLVWRVTALDHTAAPAAVFRPRYRGYVINDANDDISGD